jgi:hypothetical protein
MRHRFTLVFALLALNVSLITSARSQSGPLVFHEIYHDTSAPARTYTSAPVSGPAHPLERPSPVLRAIPGPIPSAPDAAEQPFALPPVAATIGLNFDGIPNSANAPALVGIPSDSNLSVGDTQVVETINTAYEVYNKDTGRRFFPAQQISTLFTGMPGLCGQGVTFFFTDPIVLYDKIAGRWIISIVAGDNTFSTGNECIAVSTSSDATGRYHRYAFQFGKNNFNDYPKLAVWPDAYYASYNLFTPTSAFALACAYDRAAMMAGRHATVICFNNANEFSFLPSDLDGSNLPPNGEPNFFVDLATTSSLHLYRFHVDFTTAGNSTFSGPVVISVQNFDPACGGGSCIPQAGTEQGLESLSGRLMFRLAYRNMLTHESLVVNHSVKTSVAASGVRWYEIRNPNGRPSAFQQGTVTNGGLSLWMGSVAMDKAGDIAAGFSESSAATHPAIAFTGRVPGDPLNTMESPQLIWQGNGSQLRANRWGDYTSLVIDPSDDCTFWYVDQYMPSNGVVNFHTRVASFKFDSCQ